MEDPKLPVSVDNSFATDLNGDAHADESLLADEEPLEGTRDRTLSTPPAPPLEPSSPVGKDKSARSDAAEAPEKEEPVESGERDQPSALEPSPEVQAPASAHEEAEPESPPPPSPSTNGHSSGPVADQKEGEEVKSNGLSKEETDAPALEGAEAPEQAGVGEKVKRLVAKPAGVVASARKAFESKTGSTTGTSLSLQVRVGTSKAAELDSQPVPELRLGEGRNRPHLFSQTRADLSSLSQRPSLLCGHPLRLLVPLRLRPLDRVRRRPSPRPLSPDPRRLLRLLLESLLSPPLDRLSVLLRLRRTSEG